jgi:hypothetical protein
LKDGELVSGIDATNYDSLTDSGLYRGLDNLPSEFGSPEEDTPIIVVAPGLNGGKELILLPHYSI